MLSLNWILIAYESEPKHLNLKLYAPCWSVCDMSHSSTTDGSMNDWYRLCDV